MIKRVAVAAASRIEAERARALSQFPQNSASTMAMPLDQQVTVDAPTEVAEPLEPAELGEQAHELTPDAAFVEPIDGLTIKTNTETLVSSSQRPASVGDGTPHVEILPRS